MLSLARSLSRVLHQVGAVSFSGVVTAAREEFSRVSFEAAIWVAVSVRFSPCCCGSRLSPRADLNEIRSFGERFFSAYLVVVAVLFSPAIL